MLRKDPLGLNNKTPEQVLEKELEFLSKEETIYDRDGDGNIKSVDGIVKLYDFDMDREIREETMFLADVITKEKAMFKITNSTEIKKDIGYHRNAYAKALKTGNDDKITKAEAELKEVILINDRINLRVKMDKLKLYQLQGAIDQSREMIKDLKEKLAKTEEMFKIKYIPCRVWEAQNIQEKNYFDHTEKNPKTIDEINLTMNEYLVIHKCIIPKYTEDEVKLLKPNFLLGIIKCIQRGSGLYDFSHRQLLLEAIASKKKKPTDTKLDV